MQRKHLLLLVLLSGLYTLILFVTPVDRATLTKYHLSLTQVRVLDLTIVFSVYLIWGAAIYGFSMFQAYSQTIKKDADGRALRKIVDGIMILAIGSPIISIVTSGLNYYTIKHLQDVPRQVIISNYLTMAITISALSFVFLGARQLCGLTRKRYYPSGHVIYNLIFIALSALFTYLFLNHLPSANNVPLTATSHGAYYTPTWVLIPTLVIPYLMSWYLGFLAVYMLRFYRDNIEGTIYRQALSYLAFGITTVVLISIGEQVLAVFTGQLQNLSTAPLLVLIYLLLAIIAAGYILIAIGAKRLATIEKA